MMNINLLPKIPFIRKLFMPLLIGIIAFCVIIYAVMLATTINFSSRINQAERDLIQLNKQNVDLQKTLVADPLVKQYEELSNGIEAIQLTRYDWRDMIESVANLIPHQSRILSMGVNEEFEFMVILQSQDMEKQADFLGRVEQLAFFESVTLQGVTRNELTTQTNENRNINPLFGTPSQLSYEDLIEEMEKEIPEVDSEQSAALNELQWFVQQQMIQSEIGLQLPDRTYNWEVADPVEEGLITSSEWIAAQEKLERIKSFKDVDIVDAPEEAGETDNKIMVYEGSFILKLKPFIEK